jgi:hypothetical protein
MTRTKKSGLSRVAEAVRFDRLYERLLKDREWRRNLIASTVIASVSGAILLAYRQYDPEKTVESYFLREPGTLHAIAYHVMIGCSIVIMAAAAFNFRFVVFELFSVMMTARR